MAFFYINKNEQENGDHEVHTTGCSHPPETENQIALGYFNTSAEAVAAAKARWPLNRINGCYYCCPESHTS